MCTSNNSEMRKWIDGCWRNCDISSADMKTTKKAIEHILKNATVLIFSYLDGQGAPLSRAMLVAARDGLKHVWFSTNTSSRHASLIQQRNTANVYCFDPVTFEGVMLSGEAFVENDPSLKRKVWTDSYKRYYSGIDDPDFLLLRFDAAVCNYYHDGMNLTFHV
jgi:pyridoxamine 5'-phosphate oxidase